MTKIEERAANEGDAILKSFRGYRPKTRPRRSRGHGIERVTDPGAKLRDKKLPKVTLTRERKPAVDEAHVSPFLANLLKSRCDFLGEALRGLNTGTPSSKQISR